MTHRMKLYAGSFAKMVSGTKKSELRLNDGKRQLVKVGDVIEFANATNEQETVCVEVTYLKRYPDFAALYEGVRRDYPGWDKEPFIASMRRYYSPEDEARYGALEIGVRPFLSGLLLKESLADDSVLERLTITKAETWDVENATENQPKVWHALYFKADAQDAESLAGALSRALRPGEWYANFTALDQVHVIFPGQTFAYARGDANAREEAKAYGRTINLVESQLDWTE